MNARAVIEAALDSWMTDMETTMNEADYILIVLERNGYKVVPL